MADNFSAFDLCAVCISLFLLTAYQGYVYVINPKCFGGRVPFAVNLQNAGMWIRKHKEMSESPTVLLAIQTLRNTMMAGVFIGGNSINIAYSLADDYINLEGKRMKVRSVIIMVLMFSSFLCWANVIRLCSTLGYLIGTMQYSEKIRKEAIEQERAEFEAMEAQKAEAQALSTTHDASPIEAVHHAPHAKRKFFFKSKYEDLDHPQHGENKIEKHKFVSATIPDIFAEGEQMIKIMIIFFSFGFRLIFTAIPFAFYSAGPLALVISTFCLLLFLRAYDYTRHGVQSDKLP